MTIDTVSTVGELYDKWERLSSLTELNESAMDDLADFAETRVLIHQNTLITDSNNDYCQTTEVKQLAWLLYECLNGVTECNADRNHVSNLQLADSCTEFNRIRDLKISLL